jgi:AcrR family transcriptional regulator
MLTSYARLLHLSTSVGKVPGMTESTRKPGKSDRTRAAILAAAQELFAAQGYDRTTVRDIAARAAIDPAMVIRYFGGKEELFARAAVFDLRLPDLAGLPRGELGPALVAHFLDVWEGAVGTGGLPVLLRSAAATPSAAGKLNAIFAEQVAPALAPIAGADAAARAGLVSTQLLGLALCRYVLKLPPVVALPRERIVRDLGATIQRYLDG